MKKFIILILALVLIANPVLALFAPEPNEQINQKEEIPLGVGILTIVGIGGLIAFVKKEKRFMRRHVFRFEKIKKRLREEDYED